MGRPKGPPQKTLLVRVPKALADKAVELCSDAGLHRI